MDTTYNLRLDLDSRLSLGFAFGIFGLAVELIGWLLGFEISSILTGAFVTIILATFGVQIVRGVRDLNNGNDNTNGGTDEIFDEPDEAHAKRHGYIP